MEYESPDLPQIADMHRRISIYPAQLVGICLLALVPLLALLGVFGESTAQAEARSASFALHVEYPDRYRYQAHSPMIVTVENVSDQPLAGVIVSFSTSYIAQFPDAAFNPQVSRITPLGYEVALDELQPGDQRIVTVELEGDHIGSHSGAIVISANGAEPAQVAVETFILP